MQEFDLSKFAAHEPSLVLPYVYTNVATAKIEDVIQEEYKLGKISKIDRIERKNNKTGRTYNVVFVHFETWYDNEDANNARQLLLNEYDMKLYYHYNWYWKAQAYVPKEKKERKPRMEFKKKDENWPTLSRTSKESSNSEESFSNSEEPFSSGSSVDED